MHLEILAPLHKLTPEYKNETLWYVTGDLAVNIFNWLPVLKLLIF